MPPALARDSRILVLGYGNPGRQDDGLGPAAAEAIERRRFERVQTSANYQLAIEDASDAAECDVVIFVDASKTGPEPFSVAPVRPSSEVACFVSHFVRPEYIMSLCRSVYGRTPRAYLIGIRGYDFDFGEGLTERARENLEIAVSSLCRSILGRTEV